MPWNIELHEDFEPEFQQLNQNVQNSFLARARLLSDHGPTLGRPYVDTLYGTNYSNIKEIRFNADDGVWRFLFAFSPNQTAIILASGDKKGISEKVFYDSIIALSEKRFASYLAKQQV